MARYGLGRCIRSHLARTTGCASSRPLRSTSFGTGPWPTTAVRRMFWTARYSRCRLLAVADPAALQAAADRLSPDIVRRRLDYWTLVLGPKFLKKERAQLNLSRLYAISQVEYCRNFIFKRHFPIHKLFERARPVAARRRQDRCDLRHAAQSPHARQAGHGHRPDRARPSRLPRPLQERLPEAGREVLDVPAQRAGLKQPQRLRPEKGARPSRRRTRHLPGDHRPLRRLPGRMAQQPCRLPLLQRLAHPITVGAVRYPGLKIHEARVVRLFEVLLHGGPQVGGWTARQIHHAVLTTFDLSEKTYGLNQLRYDLRKLKGHGLIERDRSR